MKKSDLPAPTTDLPVFPERPAATHKGQVGRVAIIAGSRGMTGAAILSGLGALRGGAGLVRVLTPASVQPIIATAEPCYMTVSLAEGADGRVDLAQATDWITSWATVVAVGPGLGLDVDGLESCLDRLVDLPVVLDADALNLLAQRGVVQRSGHEHGGPRWWHVRTGRPTVVTPHPGEMARLRAAAGLPPLAGDDDQTRLRMAHAYAHLAGLTVVLKGHRTVVCTADQAYVNTTGNAGMATGGMGDVLTGLIAALLGQGLNAFDAARLAVHVHGRAGDLCALRIGPIGYLARDVADAVPQALAEATRPRLGFK